MIVRYVLKITKRNADTGTRPEGQSIFQVLQEM